MIAFTCTPVERPCVASNRFEMNWNSAIESWLKRGWPPVPSSDEICWPSRFNWNSRASPLFLSGSGAVALVDDVRLPGASSASAIQLRPATGSSCTCCGIDVAAERRRRDVRAAALQRSPSPSPARVDGAICRLTVAVWPTSSCTPVRVTVREAGELRGDPVGADARRNADRCRARRSPPRTSCRSLH